MVVIILALALNIALYSFLVSSSRYCDLFPGSHLFVPFSRYLVLFFSIFLSSISVFVVLSIFTSRYSCFHFLLIFFVSISLMLMLYFLFYFVDVLFPSFAVIPCLFYFSILVHFVYSHVTVQLFYLCYCLDIKDACFDCYCIIWC